MGIGSQRVHRAQRQAAAAKAKAAPTPAPEPNEAELEALTAPKAPPVKAKGAK